MHNICDQKFIEEAHVHALDSVSNIFVIYSLLTFDGVLFVQLYRLFMSLWPSFVGHLQMLQQQSKCICWKTMPHNGQMPPMLFLGY